MQSALSRHLKNTKHLKFLTILSSVFGRKNWRLTIHLRSYQLLLRALIFIFIYFWTSPYLFRKLNFYNKLYETATSSFFYYYYSFLDFYSILSACFDSFSFCCQRMTACGLLLLEVVSQERKKRVTPRERNISCVQVHNKR